eukprot:CAMPEP_0202693424 /NCGR_PEP_ID=MMETSP1385-20130828/7545_1 /ASSEMBLY_ACC=CAM_ASM_000861 /TAXON_ID=933848 /ORGANISM="Elphidium margaritaceum" /LENGTH=80 /DNA_ID=CAMNT_0049349101 /DNA_START=22 /DNA_END=261 /DNA_ORIENTATION=+
MAAEQNDEVKIEATIKVKLMNNKWVDVEILNMKMFGDDLLEQVLDANDDASKYTMLNHANMKKLKVNESISAQVKDGDKW